VTWPAVVGAVASATISVIAVAIAWRKLKAEMRHDTDECHEQLAKTRIENDRLWDEVHRMRER
jgi:hypothetical protein